MNHLPNDEERRGSILTAVLIVVTVLAGIFGRKKG